jgi:uncharacterized protein (DUF58 family)
VDLEVRPHRRGTFIVDGPWVTTTGRLGLSRRVRHAAHGATVTVVPDVRALRTFDLRTRRALLPERGFRPWQRAGEGSELARLREYVPGDDFRRIDWKATARRRRPVTREMEVERRRRVVFVVDAGRWMSQPTTRLLKLDHALNAVLLASHVAERLGDLVGLLTFSDRVLSWIPPGSGRRHQARILEELGATPTEPVESSFGLPFRHLVQHLDRRVLVVLLSDFGDPATALDLTHSLSVLSRRHLVLCVHLLDPAIEALARASPFTPEEAARRAIAEQLITERRRVLDRLRSRGARVVSCLPERLSQGTVDRYLSLRSRGAL